jgi:hypothetical protein
MHLDAAIGPVAQPVVDGEVGRAHPPRVKLSPTVNMTGTPSQRCAPAATAATLAEHASLVPHTSPLSTRTSASGPAGGLQACRLRTRAGPSGGGCGAPDREGRTVRQTAHRRRHTSERDRESGVTERGRLAVTVGPPGQSASAPPRPDPASVMHAAARLAGQRRGWAKARSTSARRANVRLMATLRSGAGVPCPIGLTHPRQGPASTGNARTSALAPC